MHRTVLATFVLFCAIFVSCGGASVGLPPSGLILLPVSFLGIFVFGLIRLWRGEWWGWVMGATGYWILGMAAFLTFSGTFAFIDQGHPGVGHDAYVIYGTIIFAFVFRKVRETYLAALKKKLGKDEKVSNN